MTDSNFVYVGTVGQAVWRSSDGGETFRPAYSGMFMEADVRVLVVDPRNPRVLFAGTDAGLYRTDNGGDQWERLETPFDSGQGWAAGVAVWSLLIHPARPDTIFAGTGPAALYRSEDGGQSWRKLNAGLATECVAIRHTRVTCLVADPADAETLWAGVEIDGLHCSKDGGETWTRRDAGMSSPDIHALAFFPDEPGQMLASTNNDLNLSVDGGATWQPQNVEAKFPKRYCRGLLVNSNAPSVVLVGNGDGPPGTMGTLQISRDAGRTWQAAELPTAPNSTMWTFAASPENLDLLFAACVLGYLYRSEDGGATWRKCRHEFGEIRSLAVTPA